MAKGIVDYLGNKISVGSVVIIAVKSGKYATLSRGYIRAYEYKPQFKDGQPTHMIEVEYSNIHKYWIPASKVVAIPDEMLPEKRRERMLNVEEAVQPS